MEKFTHRLVIETAENGFLVYVNQDFSQGTIRPKPYVFESMENLLNFVDNRFSEEKSALLRTEETYKPR
jgi:hypothetical protein